MTMRTKTVSGGPEDVDVLAAITHLPKLLADDRRRERERRNAANRRSNEAWRRLMAKQPQPCAAERRFEAWVDSGPDSRRKDWIWLHTATRLLKVDERRLLLEVSGQPFVVDFGYCTRRWVMSRRRYVRTPRKRWVALYRLPLLAWAKQQLRKALEAEAVA